ncbi:hypothetical protein PF005_g17799 [Phytophthora fragariae]|uniref:Uncharacterized protein n=1 Tax=Phytophthora fragariae TaxID=53985 RepID=A0A6A3E2U1_9STRA|nr:hypothetical protein PF009_g23761 [Phytophthora fragariae]KAE8987561.1 hypothetical protein PF011_g19532 [Phytophthora fragariae]KAE9084538.1 hypothetical protein PF010_g20785 [Phytophthora fragariae]KAE9194171.1 hypothetical protein PF005_g17799 [Phytophthora fragariae]KAE9201461.1 hypothetical protein PF002_g21525 [Phytophthora fragariae]
MSVSSVLSIRLPAEVDPLRLWRNDKNHSADHFNKRSTEWIYRQRHCLIRIGSPHSLRVHVTLRLTLPITSRYLL